MASFRWTIAVAVASNAGCASGDNLGAPSFNVSGGPPTAMVTGSAYFATPAGALNHTQISARLWGDGRTEGEWQVSSNGPVLHGNVTCFQRDGADVRISGVVEKSNIAGVPSGAGFGWLVRDLGSGGSDRVTRLFFPADVAVADTFCDTGTAPVTLVFFNTIGGNITVHR